MTPPPPSPERWQQIKETFQSAADLPPQERPDFLERACTGDVELRAEVEALLRSDARTGGLLEDAIRDGAGRLVEASGAAPPGRRLGPYRVVRMLGHGGMGAVYLAVRDDDQYHKEVAVKLLRGGLETEEAVARFRDERQILAALEHPGIVRLLDGGSTEDGLPFLVMEHVEGVPITDYCDTRGLSVRQRVELFRQVCAAVQFAHQRLVVHRDIKPRNILVGADGAPKLLDFGIAKLLGDGKREAQTRTGMHALTPEYGSPEQARGESVTVAADVYSLGTVLYEILTGVRAHRFDSDGAVAMLRTICEVDPLRPSSVASPAWRRALQGDLDNIVMKALHKEPAGRYGSVEQLSDDLHRHLEGLPVAARPSTWAYRTGKLLRRRRGLVAAAAVVLLTLSAATVVSLRQARRADDQAREARRRFEDVRRLANSLLFDVDEKIKDVVGTTQARELIVSRAIEYLDDLARQTGGDEALSRELAAAYMKIGDIQGSMWQASLGRPREGLASYAKAMTILRRLGGSDPDATTQRAMAKAHYGVGLLQFADRDNDAARASLLEAMRLEGPLPRTGDFDPRLAAYAHWALAAIQSRAGEGEQAQRTAAASLELATEWARANPSPEARYLLAVAHAQPADLRSRFGDVEAAIRGYEETRRILEQLVAEHPENRSYRRQLALAHVRWAGYKAGIADNDAWLANAGELNAAEDALRVAVSLTEGLSEDDPQDARASLEAAVNLTPLALTVGRRDADRSLPLFERARRRYEVLPPATRQAGLARLSESFTDCAVAEPLARAGRREEALAQARIGLAIVESLATGSGNLSLDDSQYRLQMCRYLVARMHHALGDTRGAAAMSDSARAGLEQLIAAKPLWAIKPYIGLVQTLQLLAEIRPRERCALHAQSATAWRSWPGTPTTFTRRRQEQLDSALLGCRAGR